MKIEAQIEPDLLNFQERQKLRDWGKIAVQLHPDPLGELAQRELDEWAHFGHRHRPGGPIWRLVAHLEAEQTRRNTTEQERVADWAHNAACHCGAFGTDTH